MRNRDIGRKLALLLGAHGDSRTPFEPAFPPVEGSARVLMSEDADSATLVYLALDEDPAPYFNEESGHLKGWFRLFGSEAERDLFIDEMAGVDQLAFVVDEYDRDIMHYAIEKTSSYAAQWEMTPRAVYVPGDATQEAHMKGLKTIGEVEIEANAVLKEYSDWCNGEVFGVITETVTLRDGMLASEVEDGRWCGYVGRHNAERERDERLARASAPALCLAL